MFITKVLVMLFQKPIECIADVFANELWMFTDHVREYVMNYAMKSNNNLHNRLIYFFVGSVVRNTFCILVDSEINCT